MQLVIVGVAKQSLQSIINHLEIASSLALPAMTN
jgi:hypothetical protein